MEKPVLFDSVYSTMLNLSIVQLNILLLKISFISPLVWFYDLGYILYVKISSSIPQPRLVLHDRFTALISKINFYLFSLLVLL